MKDFEDVCKEWAGALSWELQSVILTIRDKIEAGETCGSIKWRHVKLLKKLNIVIEIDGPCELEFTPLGSEIADYCTC